MFISAINTFFFVLIVGLILVFVKKLPAPFGRTRLRRISRITRTLEIVWSVIPLFILIGIFFWGFHGYVVAQIAPANSIEIQVTAKKWVWQFEYPDGMRTLNDIPRAGEPARSARDELGGRDSQLLRAGVPH